MNNFKHSHKRKNKSNFKTVVNATANFETFIFDFFYNIELDIKFSIERDLLNLEMPKDNEGLFFLTDRVRNPNLLIENIEKKEEINNLIIIADKISGCTFLDRADKLFLKPVYKNNKRYNLHAKVYIVNNYFILTSANLNNTNATIEHYFIINSKKLIENFNKSFDSKTKNELKYNLPKEKQFLIYINNWSYPVDFFEFIQKKEKIKDIFITNSWTNKQVLQRILKITSNFKLISANNLLLANRSRGEWINQNINLVLTDIHAKIGLIKTTNNYYVVFGSENYGFAVKNELEHLTITNNKELYNKIKSYFENGIKIKVK